MIPPLNELIHHPAVTHLGWTLLHSLWQAILLACLLGLALRGLRTSQARYLTSLGTLFGILLCSFLTFGLLARQGGPTVTFWQETSRTALPTGGWEFLKPSLIWLVVAWLGGVLLLSLRLLGGLWGVHLLRRRDLQPLPETLHQRGQELAQQMGIQRPLSLLASSRVAVPLTFGWWRPVVLLPVGALTGLSTQAIEALLAHELAHIRRHDYLVNLVQTLIETLFFYHPAVWWVSKQIGQEREHGCDDLAIATLGDRLAYAHALTDLATWRIASPAMAANGGELLLRIRRLTGQPARSSFSLAWGGAGSLACCAAFGLLAFQQAPVAPAVLTDAPPQERLVVPEAPPIASVPVVPPKPVAPPTPMTAVASAPAHKRAVSSVARSARPVLASNPLTAKKRTPPLADGDDLSEAILEKDLPNAQEWEQWGQQFEQEMRSMLQKDLSKQRVGGSTLRKALRLAQKTTKHALKERISQDIQKLVQRETENALKALTTEEP